MDYRIDPALSPEQFRAAYRRAEQADRLGWTTQQAHAIRLAATGDLHRDARGFYQTGVRAPRGRAVARDRVRALAAAGFLTESESGVTLTEDGKTALAVWEEFQPAPAVEEAEQVAPLYGGHEARRRRQTWETAMERNQADLRARTETTLARLEATEKAERERRQQQYASRSTSVWDAINRPAPAYTYESDGTVTLDGMDVTRYDAKTVSKAAPAELVPATPHVAPRRLPLRPARRVAEHGPAPRRPRWPRPVGTRAAIQRLDRARRGRPPRSALTH
ncbi:hypothetical protein [Nonomuraea recticatena]|uniref:Uncharacterized protein n=1 Tax=Nonomuraea recticatena TaxID=46178 RepID=A0ABN3T496_9ACTN